jgi:hypothetical protein
MLKTIMTKRMLKQNRIKEYPYNNMVNKEMLIY